MHASLVRPKLAAVRRAQDAWVRLVRQRGPLRVVRVAIPEAWDEGACRTALASQYAERGYEDVVVAVLRTPGDPRLLSVVTDGR